MKYFRLPLLLLFLLVLSCDVSTISDTDLNNVSNLNANIYLKDVIDGDVIPRITVHLTDGEKQIINSQIKIKINGAPLKLYVKQDLYYTKKSYYTMDDFPRSESYYFEVVLPDSTLLPLAFIKPISKKDSIIFSAPKTFSRNKDLTLNWKNINVPAELKVWKGIQDKKSKDYSGGEYAETTIKKSIRSRTGKYVIPQFYFEDSVSVATYLKIRLNHRAFGLTNPKLLPTSDIIYDIEIEKTVDMTE